MPFIIIDLQGKQTAGGYLKVDGDGAISLSDDLMIAVEPGTHCLEFSSQSSTQRGLANFNAAIGNYNTAAWAEKDAIDGKITERFSENSVMILSIISNSTGRILDLPTYNMREVSDEEYNELCDMYNSRIVAQETHEKNTVGTELLLCFFFGTFGVHKFYRGKIGMGLLYLFTAGLFGLGYVIDTIVLFVKWIKSRR